MADSNGGAGSDDGAEAGPSGASGSDTARTLIVDCTPGYGSTTYTVAVSGGLEQVDGELEGRWVTCDGGDSSRGSAARGCVVGCAHGYRFTGDVTSLDVAAPTQCSVYVDGEEVEPREFDADEEPPLQVDVSTGAKTLEPEATTQVTATVRDCDGEPRSGVSVDFRLLDSPRGRGTLDPESATTDADGEVTVTYTAPSIGSVDRIRARAGGGSATVGVATAAEPVQSAAADGDDPEHQERPGGPGAVGEQPNSLQLK